MLSTFSLFIEVIIILGLNPCSNAVEFLSTDFITTPFSKKPHGAIASKAKKSTIIKIQTLNLNFIIFIFLLLFYSFSVAIPFNYAGICKPCVDYVCKQA